VFAYHKKMFAFQNITTSTLKQTVHARSSVVHLKRVGSKCENIKLIKYKDTRDINLEKCTVQPNGPLQKNYNDISFRLNNVKIFTSWYWQCGCENV